MEVRRGGDLEIGQDLDFQWRDWAVQRVGWIVVALFIGAALLGLLGSPGPLNHTMAGEGALRFKYNRFVHYHDPETFEIVLDPAAIQPTITRIWINNAFLDNLQLRAITPTPEHVEVNADRTIFDFRLTSSSAPVTITLHAEGEHMGLYHGQIGITGQDSIVVSFDQFVFP